MILDELRRIQERKGYVSSEDARRISEKFSVPISLVYSIVSFHPFLRLKKTKHIIVVCNGPTCYMHGSEKLIKYIKDITGLSPGEENDRFAVEKIHCLGQCDGAPSIMIDGKIYRHVTKAKLRKILDMK